MNRFTRPGTGWVEVITGSMFSGKSEELIRRIRRAQIARQRVQIFKPRVDDRYADRPHRQPLRHEDAVAGGGAPRARSSSRSRTARRWSASTRGSSSTPALVQVVNTLADRGVRVIVAGLDQDYHGPAVRAHAADPRRRRIRGQDAGHLHAVRGARQPHPAARRAPPTGWWWAARRSTRRAAGAASSPDRRVPKGNTSGASGSIRAAPLSAH